MVSVVTIDRWGCSSMSLIDVWRHYYWSLLVTESINNVYWLIHRWFSFTWCSNWWDCWLVIDDTVVGHSFVNTRPFSSLFVCFRRY